MDEIRLLHVHVHSSTQYIVTLFYTVLVPEQSYLDNPNPVEEA